MYNKCTVQGTSALKNVNEAKRPYPIKYKLANHSINKSCCHQKSSQNIFSSLKGTPLCNTKKESMQLSAIFAAGMILLFAAVIFLWNI